MVQQKYGSRNPWRDGWDGCKGSEGSHIKEANKKMQFNNNEAPRGKELTFCGASTRPLSEGKFLFLAASLSHRYTFKRNYFGFHTCSCSRSLNNQTEKKGNRERRRGRKKWREDLRFDRKRKGVRDVSLEKKWKNTIYSQCDEVNQRLHRWILV